MQRLWYRFLLHGENIWPLYDCFVNMANRELYSSNLNNFHLDQLAAILYRWGIKNGPNLRLGYITRNGKCTEGGTCQIVVEKHGVNVKMTGDKISSFRLAHIQGVKGPGGGVIGRYHKGCLSRARYFCLHWTAKGLIASSSGSTIIVRL